MNLYLIRHADALPLGKEGDAARPLSDKGDKQVRLIAGALQRRGIALDAVATSPLLRAQQTAEGLIEQWATPTPQLAMCDDLLPNGKRKKLAGYLLDLKKHNVALVGHEPDLGLLAAWLMGSKKARIDFAKAGVACISCENEPGKGAGVLKWLVTPEWLGEKDKKGKS